MNIDIAESLLASWLRHERKCQIVQTNWRAPKFGALDNEIKRRIEDANTILNTVKDQFKETPIFGEQKINQILKQVEIDAIGCKWNNAGKMEKIIAGDVAFHSRKLNYGGSKQLPNQYKIVSKIVRSIIALYVLWEDVSIEIFFASPCVADGTVSAIEDALNKLRKSLILVVNEGVSLNVEIKLYLNGNFNGDIKEKIHQVVDKKNNDPYELYARSYQLYSITHDAFGKRMSREEQGIKEDNLKIGKFVQNFFIPHLEKVCLKKTQALRVIQHLQEWKLVGACSVIKEMDAIKEDEDRRYYVTPVHLNGTNYRVCNHWFTKDEKQLKEWMKSEGWKGERG